jgi:drug/metabolite transporter (DMT)-like permease
VAGVSVFVLGEKLTRKQWAGFGLMAVAIVLIMFP